jgi:hypothetical protein
MAVLVDLQRIVRPRGLPAAAALLHQPPPAVRRPRLPGQRPRPRTLRGAQAMSCSLLMVNLLLKSFFFFFATTISSPLSRDEGASTFSPVPWGYITDSFYTKPGQ